MHSTIQQQPMPADLNIVRICADLCAPGQINEFQGSSLALTGALPKVSIPADSSLIRAVRLLIRPINIDTISNSCSFPEMTSAVSVKRFTTDTPKLAAHLSAEPRAKSRNRQR